MEQRNIPYLNKIIGNNGRRYAWLILIILNVFLFIFAFGDKIWDLDGFMYTVDYDGMKNYFNYMYYTTIQDNGQWNVFEGMSYPFGDHIFYTDSTPFLAFVVKYLGLSKSAISIYNFFFLLSFIAGPLVAFKIGNELGINCFINTVLSLYLVWLSPMIMRLGEWSNLSLSLYYLLTIYLAISLFKNQFKKHLFLKGISISILIIVSAFTHLYYFPIILTFLGVFFAIQFLKGKRLQSCIGFAAMFVSAVCVVYLIYSSDFNIDLRPHSVLGFDNFGLKSNWSDYLNSYHFLSFPAIYNKSWGQYDPKFLGSAFPLMILFLIGYFTYDKLLLKSSEDKHSPFVLPIVCAGVICLFTSFGYKFSLISENIRIYNFFSPVVILSELSDTIKNFRYVSRFGMLAHMCLILITFYYIDKAFVDKRFYKTKSILFILITVVSFLDIFQVSANFKNSFKHLNVFSEEVLNVDLPDLSSYEFDAILPIPYYHVGSEVHGYIIDDNTYWSRNTYQMAIKYKKPLMSSKMSRTPLNFTKKSLSLFSENPDPDILEKLKGKKVLIAEDTRYKKINVQEDPAKSIIDKGGDFIAKWNSEKIHEFKGVKFYLVEF